MEQIGIGIYKLPDGRIASEGSVGPGVAYNHLADPYREDTRHKDYGKFNPKIDVHHWYATMIDEGEGDDISEGQAYRAWQDKRTMEAYRKAIRKADPTVEDMQRHFIYVDLNRAKELIDKENEKRAKLKETKRIQREIRKEKEKARKKEIQKEKLLWIEDEDPDQALDRLIINIRQPGNNKKYIKKGKPIPQVVNLFESVLEHQKVLMRQLREPLRNGLIKHEFKTDKDYVLARAKLDIEYRGIPGNFFRIARRNKKDFKIYPHPNNMELVVTGSCQCCGQYFEQSRNLSSCFGCGERVDMPRGYNSRQRKPYFGPILVAL